MWNLNSCWVPSTTTIVAPTQAVKTAGALLAARTVTAAGSVLLALAFWVAGVSEAAWVFLASLFVAGALDAVVDTAQNVHGVAGERWLGRSAINSFHALWSLGAATGGAIAADVRHTLVEGRVLMRDRALTTLDERSVLDRIAGLRHARVVGEERS